ncbi:MAG: hypothetical protein Q9208_003569 [Pyrenodesmia sp. 3 TL-2023]
MSKRKRESEDGSERGEKDNPKAVRPQRQHLESVLERSKKTLFQALKLARGFERQKLGRRQKVAKATKDDVDSKRLAAEVIALKSFDLYTTGEAHLYKSMLKTKSIASAPSFPPYIHSRLGGITKPHDVAHANVQARLFNSQPVKKAMDDCIASIRLSLGLDGLQGGKRKRMRKANFRQEPEDGQLISEAKELGQTVHELHGNMETDNVSETDVILREGDQASNSSGSHDYDKYNSRLAASSDESFNGFSDAIDFDSSELHAKLAHIPSRDLSLSPSLGSSGDSGQSVSPPARKKQVTKGANPSTKRTTFLPSLTMGGYWSGSEPASDDEGGLDRTERKNRRGQRERRLIAEKKHGQNAKHLKNQPRGHNRDRGWDARKGAQPEDGRGKRGRGRGGKTVALHTPRSTNRGPAFSSGANSDPIGPGRSAVKAKPAEEPLHPSWQAAKAAKQQKKAATFQGKKMVFD